MIKSTELKRAAAFTLTASVRSVAKLPVKSSVRVAVLLPLRTFDTLAMDTFGIAVTNSKSDVVTLLLNAVPDSRTVTSASSRLALCRAAGYMEEIDAPPPGI